MSNPDLKWWPELSPYLDQALELNDVERTAWLASIREQNPALARGLETLLDDYRVLQNELQIRSLGVCRSRQNQLAIGRYQNRIGLQSAPLGCGPEHPIDDSFARNRSHTR